MDRESPELDRLIPAETARPYEMKTLLCTILDGGRFFEKSNLNMLVEVDPADLPEIPDDFRWFTLSQIKQLLLEDNYINPHVRSILCHI